MAVVLGQGINDVSGGPGLMFVYLVNVFNAMPAGRIIGAIFYICVLFAGVSSIVNLYEAPIAFLQEHFKFKRAAAVGIIIGVIGLVVSIAIQPWTSVDGRCFHLHLPARRCSGRRYVLLGTGQGKGTLLLLTKALRSRSAAGSSRSASGYTLSVQFLH